MRCEATMCIAPAVTLRAALFSGMATWGPHKRDDQRWCAEVLARKPLTLHHAEVVGRVTGTDVGFWLLREKEYRAGLAAGLREAGARGRYATRVPNIPSRKERTREAS